MTEKELAETIEAGINQWLVSSESDLVGYCPLCGNQGKDPAFGDREPSHKEFAEFLAKHIKQSENIPYYGRVKKE